MRSAWLSLLLAAALAVGGCGKAGAGGQPGRPGARGGAGAATRNTMRLGGADAASDAAAVAEATYPGLTAQTHPQAVVLVDERNWPAALAASSLAGGPLRAPLLYTEGNSLPDVSARALTATGPTGVRALGGAQVIEVGTTATVPSGYHADLASAAGDPAAAGAAVEELLGIIVRAAPRRAIVVPAQAPLSLQMPAAGLAAQSGAPILFATSAGVPAQTVAVLKSLRRPAIYVIDPGALGARALGQLARLGAVRQIAEATRAPGGDEAEAAVQNAITVARYSDGSFGWGVREPGHGLAFANLTRPLDAPASALLSASGDYAPLLLLANASTLPAPLAQYLSNIQPAYGGASQLQPVHGVYNHGWLIGDEEAISAPVQAQLDSTLQIVPSQGRIQAPATPE
jgi:Cell wall binding domain 2 (CWB2)